MKSFGRKLVDTKLNLHRPKVLISCNMSGIFTSQQNAKQLLQKYAIKKQSTSLGRTNKRYENLFSLKGLTIRRFSIAE